MGVVVSDLDKSLDFYTKVIGMVQTTTFDLSEDFGKKSGLSNGVPVKIAVLSLEDKPGVTQYKIMSFDNKRKKRRSKFIQDDKGIQYITITVKSLKPFIERIKAHNVKLLGETPTPLGNGERSFVLIQDPDGTFVELIGPME